MFRISVELMCPVVAKDGETVNGALWVDAALPPLAPFS